MQKTIYVSDNEIWESVRKEATKYGKGSISGYILALHFSNLGGLARLPETAKSVQPEKLESHKLGSPKIMKIEKEDSVEGLVARADELVEGVEPEDLKKKLESVTKKIDHAIGVAEKKGATQDWRSDIKSRPKGQDGKKGK